MESAWQLYSCITVEHFLTSLYDEDMKCAFATFQGGHGPLKFVAFKKSKKKNFTLLWGGGGGGSLTSPSLLLKFPIIFSQELLFQLKWRRLRKLVPSYNINFFVNFLIFYHNEMATSLTVIFSKYCFTRSLYLFASCFIFFTPKNIWFSNKCLISNLSSFLLFLLSYCILSETHKGYNMSFWYYTPYYNKVVIEKWKQENRKKTWTGINSAHSFHPGSWSYKRTRVNTSLQWPIELS